MFPSNNSNGNNDTTATAYNDHSILHKHFCNSDDYNYNYNKQQQEAAEDLIPLPLSIFHLPSPYYNQCELELELDLHQHHDLFQAPQQQNLMKTNNIDSVVSETINMPGSGSSCKNGREVEKMAKTKRLCSSKSSKRDRHSKINTAKGPRDRRMRLSLDVARDFFGLQDILGYDKASRTVEWLLTQAKPEIDKLKLAAAAAAGTTQMINIDDNSFSVNNIIAGGKSSTSPKSSTNNSDEAEVVSGRLINIIDKAGISSSSSINIGIICNGKGGKKVRRQPRKTAFRPLIARGSREKARERAKARTKEKIMWRADQRQRFKESEYTGNNLQLMYSLGEDSSSGGIQEHQSINMNPNSLQLQLQLQLQAAVAADQVVNKELSLSPNNWVFNSLQNASSWIN